MVDLFGLVVSSGHMQKVDVGAFPSNESEHALDRERPSIYKISVEEVLVVDSGVAVDVEDVHQVVVLTVDVSANGHFLLLSDGVIDQRRIARQSVSAKFNHLESVTLMQLFLIFEVLHQLDDPLRGHFFFLLQTEARVVGFNFDFPPVLVWFLDLRTSVLLVMEHHHTLVPDEILTLFLAVSQLLVNVLVLFS